MNSARSPEQRERGKRPLFFHYATTIYFRRISKLPRGLLPSISLMFILLPLFFYGHDVKAAELAYFVQQGNYKQEGLYPIEVWHPGTGYLSYEEAKDALLTSLLQTRNECQDRTINRRGATCAITHIWASSFNVSIFQLSIPPGSEVTHAISFVIGVPFYMSCTDGFEGLFVGSCAGNVISKQRDQQCPIAPLQPLPNDPCTQSLEAGRGVDVNGACVAGLTPEMQQQAQCLADKITSLGVPYSGPTSTIRTGAYQAHLREIWEKLIELENLEDPAVKQACTSRKAEIEAHKLSHGLTDRPATSSQHEIGNALDAGKDVIRELINRVTTDTSDLQDYVNSPFPNPPACNLRWGGRFQRRDTVHFQLP